VTSGRAVQVLRHISPISWGAAPDAVRLRCAKRPIAHTSHGGRRQNRGPLIMGTAEASIAAGQVATAAGGSALFGQTGRWLAQFRGRSLESELAPTWVHCAGLIS
jgi:hypothetical protein